MKVKRKKLTEPDVMIRLKKFNFTLREQFIIGIHTGKSKLKIQCDICGYECVAMLDNKMRKGGCRNCSHRVPHTNEVVDQRLIEDNRQIKRLGTCLNSYNNIDFLCLICDHKWIECSNNILNGERGCPRCADKLPHTNESVDLELIENNIPIKRIGNIINAKTDIFWKCLFDRCNNIWNATPDNILNNNRGCPECYKNNVSKMEIEWLDYLNIKLEQRKIRLNINGELIKPDGFDSITNTIYEFYGDFWHGNPKIFDGQEINGVNHKSYEELYLKTIKREEELKTLGYNVITIWEADWKQLKKQIKKKAETT
jgi:G:T-mismatch repair DNA endonuclease (very short patch repair protein)